MDWGSPMTKKVRSKKGNVYDKETVHLDPNVLPPSKRFLQDQDYIEKLRRIAKDEKDPKKAKEALKALKYLAKFNKEYYSSCPKKDDPGALHNTPELRKDCYNRGNRQRRDVLSALGARFMIEYLDADEVAEKNKK